jgi:hypothetical protein
MITVATSSPLDSTARPPFAPPITPLNLLKRILMGDFKLTDFALHMAVADAPMTSSAWCIARDILGTRPKTEAEERLFDALVATLGLLEKKTAECDAMILQKTDDDDDLEESRTSSAPRSRRTRKRRKTSPS